MRRNLVKSIRQSLGQAFLRETGLNNASFVDVYRCFVVLWYVRVLDFRSSWRSVLRPIDAMNSGDLLSAFPRSLPRRRSG
jgi:hypothetical protein